MPCSPSTIARELYRIETVETVATERISINDEERQRQGFELQTTYRFLPGPDGRIQQQKATIQQGEDVLGELTYAPAAQIWRINRGWRRRKDKEQLGFTSTPSRAPGASRMHRMRKTTRAATMLCWRRCPTNASFPLWKIIAIC